ncbi:MAG: peptide-methionine (S)-S-oxide reductase MsrA [Parcubacteria group bacterium]|jgi:peptide-methionine (S)-S-oxide reductase
MENKSNKNLEVAVLGGGCFWCVEAVYRHVKGVKNVTAGYAGGATVNPTYATVSTGETGHAEVVKIEFDPEIITYADLLHIFFTVHNPTTLNQQGADVGTQYRSMILYANAHQREVAEKVITELSGQKVFDQPIVTKLFPLEQFFPAEEYHQRYFEKNPNAAYCQLTVAPKVAKFRAKFGNLYE